MRETADVKRVSGVDQLFEKIDTYSEIDMLMAKVTNDVLKVGKRKDLGGFVELLEKRFPISM